jgi:endoglucanase
VSAGKAFSRQEVAPGIAFVERLCLAIIGVSARLLMLLVTVGLLTAQGRADPPAGCSDRRDKPRTNALCPGGPPALNRGINLTNWFRFPASRDPAALANYMSDQGLADLRAAGFDFVRLAVDPDLISTRLPILVTALRRIQRQGLTVIVSPHPNGWSLETKPEDRERLRVFWHNLAPALRLLDPARTVPEVLNEPVFPGDPTAWAALQHLILAEIRQTLPQLTVVLTGQDWGSIGGLLALTPETDPNVVYSFHLYEPSELTSLAAYRPGLDRGALARLPFPVDDPNACKATADVSADPSSRELMRYYCALEWNVSRMNGIIQRAAEWAHRNHVKVLAGEFGASAELNQAARTAWLQTVRVECETKEIGWALWGYDDIMGFAVPHPPGPRPALDRSILAALGMASDGARTGLRDNGLTGQPPAKSVKFQPAADQ